MDRIKMFRLPAVRIFPVAVMACVIGFAVGDWAPSASGQGRRSKSSNRLQDLERNVKKMIDQGTLDQKIAKDYYVSYVIGAMKREAAWKSPQLLPRLRSKVVSDLNKLQRSEANRRHIRKLVFNAAGRLAIDKSESQYARYNAILLIAELNEREAIGRDQPPVPYANGTQLLLRIAKGDEPDALKVGALIGLARHAKLQAAAGANIDGQIMAAFVEVLKMTEADSQEGLHWMQQLAVDVLGDSGNPGAVKLLQPIVADDGLPRYLRCSGADAIGRLDFASAKIDQLTTAKSLGQLAIDSLMDQIEELRKYAEENPNGADGMMQRAAIQNDETGDDKNDRNKRRVETVEDPFVLKVRRQLMHELRCVRAGLNSVSKAPGGDANAKQLLSSLQSELDKINRELTVKGALPIELFEKIRDPALKVEAAVKQMLVAKSN